MFVILPSVWVTGSQFSPLGRDEPPSPFTRQKVEKQNLPDRSSASFSGLPPTHCFKLWMAGQRRGVGLLKKALQRVKSITLNDNGPTVYPHIRSLVYSPPFQWPSVISPPLKPLQLPAWYSPRAAFECVCVCVCVCVCDSTHAHVSYFACECLAAAKCVVMGAGSTKEG